MYEIETEIINKSKLNTYNIKEPMKIIERTEIVLFYTLCYKMLKMTERIYPKFSKEKFDKEFDLLCKQYEKNNPNYGLIKHPKKMNLINRIKLFFNVL